MSMIKLENLTFSYPKASEYVFENFNATIDTEWKLALTGRNGRGKTTLLKLLSGKYEFKGKIVSSVKCDYFPYEIKDKRALTAEILAEICPAAKEWEILKEFTYLGIEADALDMPYEYLSGGEQTKVLLAAMFLNDGRYLLIDEPTNHLDSIARKQVSQYLKRKNGFILVSHDREFLDGCVDCVMALNRTGTEIRKGNFTTWLNEFEARQLSEQAENEKLQREIRRLKYASEKSADWARQTEAEKNGNGPVDRGYIGHKAAKMMKRAKVIESRQKKLIAEKSSLLKDAEVVDELKMSALKYRSDFLAVLDKVQVCYGGTAVCGPVSFTVSRGQRIALCGGNGSGKSSVLKALIGRHSEYTGRIARGSGLIISYVPQDVSALRGNIREMLKAENIEESIFMANLYKMGVEESLLDNDMSELSDGQKKKVLISKSLCESAHLYVWDEPLNYIDVYCRVQLERLIARFAPAMVFIEHDVSFRNAVATDIVDI